jgi:hypothetical protein
MNYRKIYGGTPSGTESRCDTCSYVRLIQGYAESEKIVICDRFYEPMRIHFKVYQCSDYVNRNLPDVDDLEKIAWMLRPSERVGRKAGFISPQERLLLAEDEDED